MSEGKCYQHIIKLNRLFNIQSKADLIPIGILLLFAIYMFALSFINDTVDIKHSIVFACGCVAIMIAKLLSHPKYLEITPDTVRFKYNTILISMLIRGRVLFGANNKSRYERSYILYNIKSIEYLQTTLEKRFSCGHLRITADVNSGSKKGQQTFVIYGVTDFENTADMIRGFVNLKPQEQ